jgi:putative solute:sodium symporter small subunit
MNNRQQHQAYWRANTTLIRSLLLVWAAVSLGCGILLVKPLNFLSFGQIPLGFWIAQQGAIFIFVILIFIYAFQMEKIDRKYKE